MTNKENFAVQELSLGIASRWLVEDVSFEIPMNQTVGLFGSSGSGKSSIARALANQLAPEIITRGILSAPERTSLVQQNPFLSFNPVICVGDQIAEVLVRGKGMEQKEASIQAVKLIGDLGLTEPAKRYKDFSLQFSGGELQRLAVAKALAFDPNLLILDEATSALDEANQNLVLDFVGRHQQQTGCAVILVSHSLELIKERCSYAVFLESGQVMEQGSVDTLLTIPKSERLQKLVSARQGFRKNTNSKLSSEQILSFEEITVFNPDQPRSELVSVSNFSLAKGESVGIVAPSGSGKSSLLKGLLGSYPAKLRNAKLTLRETVLTRVSQKAKQSFGYVLQDPRDSFDPRRIIGSSLAFAAKGIVAKGIIEKAIVEVLDDVGLDTSFATRLPSQLSGGQLQRASIARSLITKPEVLFLDEPTSALDQENEVLILDLLQSLREKYGLTILLISHSSFVTKAATDRVISL